MEIRPGSMGRSVPGIDAAVVRQRKDGGVGKIMRRLLKARELGLPQGDISTLES